MGKRYPEYIVDPNDIVKLYGADTLRLYEMFMAFRSFKTIVSKG